MKKFRISIPAHVTVEIDARDRGSAIRKAKDMQSFSSVPSVPGADISGVIGGWDICAVDLGKFDVGSDRIEEVEG